MISGHPLAIYFHNFTKTPHMNRKCLFDNESITTGAAASVAGKIQVLKNIKLLYYIFCVLLLFSCNQINNKVFDKVQVKAHIIEMNKTYSNRFMTNDTAFYMERYCKDAEVFSPGVPAVKGRNAIIGFFYQNGTNKETKIDLPVGNIYGNEELVVEEGTYNFPYGKGGSIDKGKFIAIWKQEDGKWKMYREIWNTDIAPKQ